MITIHHNPFEYPEKTIHNFGNHAASKSRKSIIIVPLVTCSKSPQNDRIEILFCFFAFHFFN